MALLFVLFLLLSHSVVSDSFVNPWTIARQVHLSKGLSRQEYQNALPCPAPGDLPKPGTEPVSPIAPALQADSLPLSDHWSNQFW